MEIMIIISLAEVVLIKLQIMTGINSKSIIKNNRSALTIC